jgi:hypothetical protein
MVKTISILLLLILLATGCAQKSVSNHSHAHDAVPTRPLNDRVLNCVVTSGHHVYEEETECPLGGERFKALNLGTHSTYGSYLDWEPISYMRFPVPIPVCPGNGFVIGEPEYNAEQVDKLATVVQSDAYQHLYDQKHATYYLYAKILELSGQKSSDQWWLYLNATWEADNCGDRDRYKEYAYLVITESEKKLAGLSSDNEEYWVLKIIIPNMYRRIGEFQKAEEYLNKIGQPTFASTDTNEHILLAKRLLAEAIYGRSMERVAIKEPKDS